MTEVEEKATRSVNIDIEFGGGLETLFNYEKSISLRLDVPKDREDSTVTIAELADHLCNEVLTEKPELFMLHKSIRPGILVLINDADWELEGGMAAVLQDGDKVAFISTLHGG